MGEVENMTEIRLAKAEDMAAVHNMVMGLAEYEKAPQEVVTTAKQFVDDGFGAKPWFSCLVAEHRNEGIIGFALYFPKYSTWKGKALYLEDFFVKEAYRKGGVGQLIFKALVQQAQDLHCQRMEWQVLDWNDPAISFYKKIGADLDDTWINGKLFPKDFKRILEA